MSCSLDAQAVQRLYKRASGGAPPLLHFAALLLAACNLTGGSSEAVLLPGERPFDATSNSDPEPGAPGDADAAGDSRGPADTDGDADLGVDPDGDSDPAGDDDPGPTYDPLRPPPPEEVCGEMQLAPTLEPPNLLLVLDRSGSMRDPISAASERAKIDDAKEALGLLLDKGEGSIGFGFMPFPTGDACAPGELQVGCAPDSVPAIRAAVGDLFAEGGTPTGPTLAEVLASGDLAVSGRASFVVLLTDGLPTCPNGAGTEVTPEDAEGTVAAVSALHDAAIDTFVIGIGEDLNASDPELLSDMAQAGGRARQGQVSYYQANSIEELNAALDAVSVAVFGCTFTLEPAPVDAERVWVTLDGEPLDRDAAHASGWDYDATQNQVTVYGAACERLQNGDVAALSIIMGCEPPPPPPPPPPPVEESDYEIGEIPPPKPVPPPGEPPA